MQRPPWFDLATARMGPLRSLLGWCRLCRWGRLCCRRRLGRGCRFGRRCRVRCGCRLGRIINTDACVTRTVIHAHRGVARHVPDDGGNGDDKAADDKDDGRIAARRFTLDRTIEVWIGHELGSVTVN